MRCSGSGKSCPHDGGHGRSQRLHSVSLGPDDHLLVQAHAGHEDWPPPTPISLAPPTLVDARMLRQRESLFEDSPDPRRLGVLAERLSYVGGLDELDDDLATEDDDSHVET